MHTSRTLESTILGSLAILCAPIAQDLQKRPPLMKHASHIPGYSQQSPLYHLAYPAPMPNNISLGSCWRTRSSPTSLRSRSSPSSRECRPEPFAVEAPESATSGLGWEQIMPCGAIARSEVNACLCSLNSQVSVRKRWFGLAAILP